ncbi:hypothetical protein B0H63DRAFT_537508 [Podospora didyma]|uniref:Secreted protein n=1 Tax=Podospora didyma TaxID=330526 RepID=A0AAE0NXN4_9PEZI|nr:hypothetical protein B0H63DRAFT_537508 [Podospora didyma]
MMFCFHLLSIACAIAGLVSPARAWPIWWLSNKIPSPTAVYEERNLKTIQGIYNLTVYPNQLPIITAGASQVPSGLFSQNVVGRVDPVGDFHSFQDSIEYFFALSPVPQANAVRAAITSFQITEFTSACANVAASVVYLFCTVVNPCSPDHGKQLATLKQVAFWRFDDAGAVVNYDAWIPNLNSWVVSTQGVPISNPQAQVQAIQQLCAFTQLRCTGANTQWASTEECVTTLSQRPFGNYDEAWGDNIVCRTIHLVLTQVRPDHHCPHVGPTGGGKCVDIPSNAYFEDVSLYGNPLGKTFTCNRTT